MSDWTDKVSTIPSYTAWVCVNCYFSYHGTLEEYDGDINELLSLLPRDQSLISAGLLREQHADCCHGEIEECECEHDDFSSRPCQGCGSYLGGTRDALTVWEYSDE